MIIWTLCIVSVSKWQLCVILLYRRCSYVQPSSYFLSHSLISNPNNWDNLWLSGQVGRNKAVFQTFKGPRMRQNMIARNKKLKTIDSRISLRASWFYSVTFLTSLPYHRNTWTHSSLSLSSFSATTTQSSSFVSSSVCPPCFSTFIEFQVLPSRTFGISDDPLMEVRSLSCWVPRVNL